MGVRGQLVRLYFILYAVNFVLGRTRAACDKCPADISRVSRGDAPEVGSSRIRGGASLGSKRHLDVGV